MKKKSKAVLLFVAALAAGGLIGYALGGGISFAPPVAASLPQDPDGYGPQEKRILDTSKQFWSAMEQADEDGMRMIADTDCAFVHIGMTCKLDEEISFYTNGTFRPESIEFHGQSVNVYGDTAVVITDCDYSLKIGIGSASHHFAVTEVYVSREDEWKLIQFSFTSLIS